MRCPSLVPLMAFAAGVGAASLAAPAPRAAGPSAAGAAEVAPRAPAMPGAFAAEVLRVVDGDTLDVRVAVWPGQEILTKIRIAGIDTPEMAGRCPEERRAAEAAREALADLVADRRIVISEVRPDKYFGRVVARVAAGGGADVAVPMREAGHARAYSGGRRRPWCEAGALTSVQRG